MLKKLYDRSHLLFSILWIAAYCVFMSLGDFLSEITGHTKIVTLPVGILISAVLLLFLKKYGLTETYGLRPASVPPRTMLYYIPLAVLLTANLWHGAALTRSAAETVLFVLSMCTVGFLEEIIFRGFLFNSMRRENPVSAVVVSSLTFGIGHIINLVNGSGAEFFSNLLQVLYACAAGFMFVMIYCRTDSLYLCIAFHALFNAMSVFSTDTPSKMTQILSCAGITVISGAYAVYIALSMYRENRKPSKFLKKCTGESHD